jgi:hypothetical protein
VYLQSIGPIDQLLKGRLRSLCGALGRFFDIFGDEFRYF